MAGIRQRLARWLLGPARYEDITSQAARLGPGQRLVVTYGEIEVTLVTRGHDANGRRVVYVAWNPNLSDQGARRANVVRLTERKR